MFGNGDIRCGADAVRMMDQTGCDAVIVGRAAQGNPWIFREIAAALRGGEAPPVTPRELLGGFSWDKIKTADIPLL